MKNGRISKRDIVGWTIATILAVVAGILLYEKIFRQSQTIAILNDDSTKIKIQDS